VGCRGRFTDFTQWCVEESGKGGGLFGAFLAGLDRRARCRARCGSTLEPHPIPEHAEPQQSKQQQVMVKPVVSHLLPPMMMEGRYTTHLSGSAIIRSRRYTTKKIGMGSFSGRYALVTLSPFVLSLRRTIILPT
jgi:hypothetical protein